MGMIQLVRMFLGVKFTIPSGQTLRSHHQLCSRPPVVPREKPTEDPAVKFVLQSLRKHGRSYLIAAFARSRLSGWGFMRLNLRVRGLTFRSEQGLARNFSTISMCTPYHFQGVSNNRPCVRFRIRSSVAALGAIGTRQLKAVLATGSPRWAGFSCKNLFSFGEGDLRLSAVPYPAGLVADPCGRTTCRRATYGTCTARRCRA